VPYVADQATTPNSSYAVSKAAARELIELYRRLYGVTSMTLRPTVVFGPGQPRNIFRVVAEKLAAGEDRMDLMGGQQTRAPVYIDDVLDAFVRAGTRLTPDGALDGRTIPVGGDEEVRVVDLVRRMASLAGRSLIPVLIEGDTRPTEIYRSAADNADAARLIGWRPAISLDEGLRRTLRHEGVLPAVRAAPAQLALST
jgi:UDP-glucose 4-epimerase